jgi:glyoxylase I family protein
MSLLGFEHAGMAVADLDRSIASYCDLLGLKLRLRKPNAAFLEAPGGMLELFGTPHASRAVDVPAGTAGLRHVTFAVDDVDKTVALLEASGVEITERPRNAFNTELIRRVAFCRDPDGIQVELIERSMDRT